MKRRRLGPALWIAAILAGLILAVALRFDFTGHLEADACEDAGGRWERTAQDCDFTLPEDDTPTTRRR